MEFEGGIDEIFGEQGGILVDEGVLHPHLEDFKIGVMPQLSRPLKKLRMRHVECLDLFQGKLGGLRPQVPREQGIIFTQLIPGHGVVS